MRRFILSALAFWYLASSVLPLRLDAQKPSQAMNAYPNDVAKDGSVTVQSVLQGDPMLSPAAIEAAKHWRYELTLVDGKPMDMETTIEVTFTLKP
jgi:TonB family protein